MENLKKIRKKLIEAGLMDWVLEDPMAKWLVKNSGLDMKKLVDLLKKMGLNVKHIKKMVTGVQGFQDWFDPKTKHEIINTPPLDMKALVDVLKEQGLHVEWYKQSDMMDHRTSEHRDHEGRVKG